VSITISGLRPQSTVTLGASTRSTAGNVWTSSATFRADANGRVIVARSPALAGSYRGRDGMGLFWSMRWNACTVCAMPYGPVSTVRLAASQGSRVLATASVTRRTGTSAVTVHNTTLAGEGFVGCFYSAATETTRAGPAMLMLGGSEGGLRCDERPRLLASRGYPTLRLAYFRAPGLPQDLVDIPLEYFATALRWLAKQPGVDPARLVVLGVSRGGEAALLIGSVFPDLVDGVVSYVGSSVVNPGYAGADPAAWTLGGKAIPTGTTIAVEKIAGPIFLVAGADDLLWPSAIYSAEIVQRLREHGRTDYTSLVYQRAGHLVGVALPYVVLVDPSFGGTAAADAHARADSWPKLLAFLDRLR
jgi:dienelactone hydrolase